MTERMWSFTPLQSSAKMYRVFPQVQETLTSRNAVDEPEPDEDEREGKNDTKYGSEHWRASWGIVGLLRAYLGEGGTSRWAGPAGIRVSPGEGSYLLVYTLPDNRGLV